MSLNPTTHGSGIQEQQGSNHAGSVTRDASGMEEGLCKDEDKVEGGSHSGRDLGSVKMDDAKSEISQQLGGKSEAPKNLESTTDLHDRDSFDCSSSLCLPQQEQAFQRRPFLSRKCKKSLPQDVVVVDSADCSAPLPEELVRILFEYMKPSEILQAAQTCKLWRIVGEDDKLWEQKCKEDDIAYSLPTANLTALERLNETSSISYSAWKQNFLRPYKIAKKIREGIPQEFTVDMKDRDCGIREGYDNVEIKFCDDKIVTTARNTLGRDKLYIFSALSGELLHELEDNYTRNVQINNQFVAGSFCNSVKVWNVDTGAYLHTLGHRRVHCLDMHGTFLVSGSWDTTLKMWDLQEGVCLRTFTGHTGWVLYVQFDGRVVVSGSDDRRIKIWNAETCLRTMYHGHIRFLKLNGVNVVAGYGNGFIKVWEVDTGVCRQTLEGNNTWGRGLIEMQGDLLVCKGADGTTANIWNMSTGARLHTLAGPKKHTDAITGIGVNGKLVVTSSWDGTVKLWDVQTGEFIRDLLETGGKVMKMRMKEAKIVCYALSNEGPKILVLNFDTNSN